MALCLLLSLTSCNKEISKPEKVTEIIEPQAHRLQPVTVDKGTITTGVEIMGYLFRLEAAVVQSNCDKYAVRKYIHDAKTQRNIASDPPPPSLGIGCEEGGKDASHE